MSELQTKIMKLGNKAVKKAQLQNHKLGFANVYSKNKKIYFQLPNGTITDVTPKEYIWLPSSEYPPMRFSDTVWQPRAFASD